MIAVTVGVIMVAVIMVAVTNLFTGSLDNFSVTTSGH